MAELRTISLVRLRSTDEEKEAPRFNGALLRKSCKDTRQFRSSVV